ncbi:hypothetical protein CVV43_00060 [Candidatus Saccharibacteria bacterium HGW-Saccharibacteria-1]|nr:MAG: hypothetical protein CVV43_00060 [Candidatus Saccharibacteria bacterium HGW-Saccharibacteria-1]
MFKVIVLTIELDYIVYMIRVTCSALITYKDTILLIHESKVDKYGLPGGKLEEGETLRNCAKRECLEEMGAAIEIDNLIMITEKPKTHEGNTVIRFIYKAHIIKESSQAELDYKYFNKAEFTKLADSNLVRGQDVIKLIYDFYQGDIESITEPVIFN